MKNSRQAEKTLNQSCSRNLLRASTTKVLELIKKILTLRKETTSIADRHTARELVKKAVKEILTEYRLTP